MKILICSIIFAILYATYAGWIHIKSSVLLVERLKNDENSIENVTMQQYFHFQ